jgi:hypothetical protein
MRALAIARGHSRKLKNFGRWHPKVGRQPLQSKELSSRVWALKTSYPSTLSQKLIPKLA